MRQEIRSENAVLALVLVTVGSTNDCEELLHETGTFLANRERSLKEE